MPVVYQQDINPFTKLAVWHILEEESFFNDIDLKREIPHPKKRLQHLAGRNLLKHLYPDFPLKDIKIPDTRKPYLESDPFHFSISHCGDYAAAIVSTKYKTGVDIERPVKKIELIRNKFLQKGEIEKAIGSNDINFEMLTAAWSIKEAFFKWYGKGMVDFKRDMSLKKILLNDKEIFAILHFGKEIKEDITARGRIVEENFLIWVVS